MNNGGCTHLCLATPGSRTCRCPDNTLGVDCIERKWRQECLISFPSISQQHSTWSNLVQIENCPLAEWPLGPDPAQPEPQQLFPHCSPKHAPWTSLIEKSPPLHKDRTLHPYPNPQTDLYTPEWGLHAHPSVLGPFPNTSPPVVNRTSQIWVAPFPVALWAQSRFEVPSVLSAPWPISQGLTRKSWELRRKLAFLNVLFWCSEFLLYYSPIVLLLSSSPSSSCLRPPL